VLLDEVYTAIDVLWNVVILLIMAFEY